MSSRAFLSHIIHLPARLIRIQTSKSGTSRKLFLEPIPADFTDSFRALQKKPRNATSTRTRVRTAAPSTSRSKNVKEVEATETGAEAQTKRPVSANDVDVNDVDVSPPAAASAAFAGAAGDGDGNGSHVGEAAGANPGVGPEPEAEERGLGLTAEQQRAALETYGAELLALAIEVIEADPNPAGTARAWFVRDPGLEFSPGELQQHIEDRARLNDVVASKGRSAEHDGQ